jgi:hypothetical protein
VPDIVAVVVRGALKTEEAVLDELAEPTPLRRSPENRSASSCDVLLLVTLIEVSGFASDIDTGAGEFNEACLEVEFACASSARSSGWLSRVLSISDKVEDFRCMTLWAAGKNSANLLPGGRDIS